LSVRAKGCLRIGLRLAAATLLGLVLLEGSLRFLLFSDSALARRFGAELRRPANFSSRFSGREYWKLATLFEDGPDVRPHYDARFGWLNPDVDPATLRHADEPLLAGRRPVLFFGDSFGECFVPPEQCWQGLLERSPLAGEYRLLNYAAKGYGLDQMLLLMRAVLDLHLAARPVVVIGIQVEDDLDRCYLALRDYPKPYFTAEGDELVLQPIEHASRRDFVRADPVGIRSYAWRLALVRSGLVRPGRLPEWTGESGHVRAKKELARRILAALQAELVARELPFFFVLFHGREALKFVGPYPWQEVFLYEELGARGLAFVSAKRFLLAASSATRTPLDDYYIAQGLGLNHYDAAGNAVVFEALLDGLRGRFEPAREYLPGVDASKAVR
jgi:hypothetical protein